MIKIDMEMPESCEKCPFQIWDDDYALFRCVADDISVDAIKGNDKHPDCPLIEVKE
jgi:hypothetical protein